MSVRLRFVSRLPARLAAAVLPFAWMPAPAASLSPAGLPEIQSRLAGLPLPPGSRRLSFGNAVRINGVPAVLQLFESAEPVDAVARALARQLPGKPEWAVLPGVLLLSWRDGGWHWVAQLSGQGAATRGALSALAERGAERAPQSAPWLPSGAQLLLELSSVLAHRQVVQQIYAHRLPPERLAPLVGEALRRNGWRALSPWPAGHGAGRWERAAERMVLHLTPLDRGSGLTVNRTAPLSGASGAGR